MRALKDNSIIFAPEINNYSYAKVYMLGQRQ